MGIVEVEAGTLQMYERPDKGRVPQEPDVGEWHKKHHPIW